MSQYIHFFIKTTDGIFYPIGTFCRSDVRYTMFEQFAPAYDYVKPLNRGDINLAIQDAKDNIKHIEESIQIYEREMDWLRTAEGSMEDKMDYLHSHITNILDLNAEIQLINEAIIFASTLILMIEEAEDDERFFDESSCWGLNSDEYIYVGIECGNPNVEWDSNGVISNPVTGYKRGSSDGE